MNWLHIILEANLYLTLFYALYFFAFQKETYFNMNRGYLVSCVLVSFGIPFWKSEAVQSWFITKQVSQQWSTMNWSEIVAAPVSASQVAPQFSWLEILAAFYMVGALAMLLIFLANLFNVRKLLIHKLPEGIAGSFLNKVLIDPQLPYADVIELHEQAHTKELHTIDIILIEMTRVVCWFNPFAHLMAIEIRKVHEFLADKKAITYLGSKKKYAEILVSNFFKSQENILIHNFYEKATLKTRLLMIKRKNSPKIAILKYGLIAPLFVGLMILTSSFVTNNPAGNIKHEIENFSFKGLFQEGIKIKGYVKTADGNGLPGASIKLQGTDRVTITDLSGKFTFSDVPRDAKLTVAFIGYESKQFVATDTPVEITLFESNLKIEELVVVGNEDQQSQSDRYVANDVSIEREPQFPGGQSEMYRFIASNLIYPYSARAEKVEGQVMVQFVVDKNGNAVNPEVIKGLGYGCDEEVKRIVDIMPKWLPARQNGMPVNVRYTMPVNFKLSKAEAKNTTSETSDEQTYTTVEQIPEYKGGVAAMYKFIAENLRYPEDAKEAGTEGRLFVRFTVTKEGAIENIKILKGLGHGTEDEVRRVLKLMPAWTPGMQDGKPVNVYFTMPVVFKLNSSDSKTVGTETPIQYYVNGSKTTEAIAKAIDPDKIKTVDVRKGEGNDAVYIVLKSKDEKQSSKNQAWVINDSVAEVENALYVVDGKKMSKAEFDNENIRPSNIATLNVLKGEQAISVYGAEGKNGVIVINLKKENAEGFSFSPSDTDSHKVTLAKMPKDLMIIVDGKEVSRSMANKLDSNDIKTVTVYKNEKAIEKYGKKAKNGVVVITTKK